MGIIDRGGAPWKSASSDPHSSTASLGLPALPSTGDPSQRALSAFLIGRTAELGWWRLVALITIAVLYVLHTVATFSLSNALGLTNIAPADLAAFMYGLIPAAIGLAIGWVVSLSGVTRRV